MIKLRTVINKKIPLIVILFSLVFIQCKDKKTQTTSQLKISPVESFDQRMEPIGGQPALGAKPSKDIEYQVKYQRAFEVGLWAMPAVVIYRFRAAAIEGLGYKDNDIIAYSKVATPRLEVVTSNSSTPYIAAFSDLRAGPTVLEVPAAGSDGSLYGQVVDHWQLSIADVGPSGLDKGKGAKYLFTPPGYDEKIPAGYIHVPSPSYRIALAFRSVIAPGKTAEDAYNYSKKLRMYRLSEANNKPEQKFWNYDDKRFPALPFYDARYFKDVHAIFSVENAREIDKVMEGMARSLGIEHGNTDYNPNEKTLEVMEQAMVDVYTYLHDFWDNHPDSWLYWKDRHYASLMQADANRTFTYEYNNFIDIETKAIQFAMCTYVPTKLSDNPATQYIMAMRDADGSLFEANKTYSVVVPANMPVKQFWALTVYDKATFSFIYTETNKTTISSYDLPNLKKNDDGSVTLYVGPKAPDGLENNWIPTRGKSPMPMMRLYGPKEEFINKSFKMPDFIKVD